MMEPKGAAVWIGEAKSIDGRNWIVGAGLAGDAVIFADPLKKGK